MKTSSSKNTTVRQKEALTFEIKRHFFDENYVPSKNTRTTTNFANLARGKNRQTNLRNTITMINKRFNTLANWDNLNGKRYAVELEIISVELSIDGNDSTFPSIEMLKTHIIDQNSGKRIEGIVGNNFSSYVRDYDFSVLLLEQQKQAQATNQKFQLPEDFGDLHGNIFKAFVNSDTYKKNFNKAPVICLSVSSNKIYERTSNYHPVLGYEYQTAKSSLTEMYFEKMGLQVRYFMPKGSVAPLAFYFSGDLLADYSNLELIATISTMETFQKIYRPEIYNANTAAGLSYNPSLDNENHSLTKIVYDREERSQLAVEQGKFTEKHFITPYKSKLENWCANYA